MFVLLKINLNFFFIFLLFFEIKVYGTPTDYESATVFEVPVFINERKFRTAYMIGSDQPQVFIQTDSIQHVLSEVLVEEYYDIIFQQMEHLGYCFSHFEILSKDEMEPEIIIEFEECDQKIQITIQPSLLKQQILSCYSESGFGNLKDCIPSANWSGYLNVRYGKGLGYIYLPEFQNISEPHHVLSNFAIQHNDWALTGTINPNFNHLKSWSMTNLLWVKDEIFNDRRIFLGEFSPNTIGNQYSVNMLGIGLMRSPYSIEQAISPARSYQFFLPQASEVDVFINGALYNTYDLPAGSHSIENFPMTPGGNKITLRIHNYPGGMKFLDTSYFYEPSLLDPGEIDYFSSFGILQNNYGNRFNWNQPAFSGYMLYGVTSQHTSGGYLQLTRQACQFGVENRWIIHQGIAFVSDIGASWMYHSVPRPRCRLNPGSRNNRTTYSINTA